MGDLADAIVDGKCCEVCGVFFDVATGYPVRKLHKLLRRLGLPSKSPRGTHADSGVFFGFDVAAGYPVRCRECGGDYS